jgi:hypothetical protein
MKNLMAVMLQYNASSVRGPGNLPRPRVLPSIRRPVPANGGPVGGHVPAVIVPTAAGRRGSRPVVVKVTIVPLGQGQPSAAYEA